MAKFTVGDRVRRIRGGHGRMNVGDIATVVGVRPDEVRLKEYDSWHMPVNLELITDYTPITPKVGERYRVVKLKREGKNPFSIGDIITLIQGAAERKNCMWRSEGRDRAYLWNYDSFNQSILTTEYLELVEEPAVSREITAEERRFLGYEIVVEQPTKQSLITKVKTYMTNLYRRAKLTADEKILLKAGYITDDGTPTIKGYEADAFINFSKNKAELVKMAQEELDEEKE